MYPAHAHLRVTSNSHSSLSQPNDFLDEQYALRQILYETPRRTELFIVMTMYNEDEVLFCRTMHGVMSKREALIVSGTRADSHAWISENIQHLCERTRSKTWGADGWKKGICAAQPMGVSR